MLTVAAVGVVKDVLVPYKKKSDADNRDMVEWLADRTGPGDRWAVFGRYGTCEYAPDLYPWGGSAARMRYYLLLHAGQPVLWAPRVEDLELDGPDRIWFIVYRDNNTPFPVPQWESYRKELVARLGTPRIHSFPFGSGVENADVLEFRSH
jgi:hypothetical protein